MSQLKITDDLGIPLKEIGFQFSRSGGPGGQNVNKVNTRVTLRWVPAESDSLPYEVLERLLKAAGRRVNSEGVLQISSQRYRDQGRNVADCIEKLRILVAAATVVPKKRRKTKPSKAACEKRLKEKKRRSEQKRQRKLPADD